ncbi:VWA domain-containing protein [Natronosporangium hydrolyticum]|uniref:VWA domain-containing protein n=1 Tax=Natronosporangium hydrolyticum TaxID=2811111 RepID=A0A895YKI6_9ACTN|nr:VWA domain-containing protein [Natronosporangium hydrolyticum]QSB16542.1 VWA domain-containing protein [Natronosporangium hydrolyticum]
MTDHEPDHHDDPVRHTQRRQLLYWRLLARLFDPAEQPGLESVSVSIAEDIGLPSTVLDPAVTVDTLVQRHPALAEELTGLLAGGQPATAEQANTGQANAGPTANEQAATDQPITSGEVRRAALAGKLLLNVFGTGSSEVTAAGLARWQADAGWFERSLGVEPGQLRHHPDHRELGTTLADLEGDLVRRMRLREVLADPALAAQLTPSMSLIEQLLRDKSHLSGVALANAKALIRRFIDEVAQVLRTQVAKASVGEIDRSVPPKRVFRNLDLQRTVWRNLPNWSPADQLLYVDRLYFRRTARRTTPARLIVVVDQSGSMVDSMVNCTILASIFAGLPNADVHLIAYDTQALDLTPWVHDPFETLLRTQLGGGTDGRVALEELRPKVADPRQTAVVWISDLCEWHMQAVLDGLTALHRSGVKLIPVGSVTSSGRGHTHPWFAQRLKELGTPVLSGHIRKLVSELKSFLS